MSIVPDGLSRTVDLDQVRTYAETSATHHFIDSTVHPMWRTHCELCGREATAGSVYCAIRVKKGMLVVMCSGCIEAIFMVMPPDATEARMLETIRQSTLLPWSGLDPRTSDPDNEYHE